MNRTRLYVELFAAVVCLAALYVFLPVIRSRVTVAWTSQPQTVTTPAPQSQPMAAIQDLQNQAALKPAAEKRTPIAKHIAPEEKSIAPTAPETVPVIAPRATSGYLERGAHGRFAETFKVIAGGELNVENDLFDRIEIRSTYPVAIQIGDCRTTGSVDFQCSGMPQNIQVFDNRKGSDPTSTPANAIQILARDSKFFDPQPKGFTVRAGHPLRLQNSRCRNLRVHSDIAVSVVSGACSDVATHDFECDNVSPTDVIITSFDPDPILVTLTCGDGEPR